MKLNSPLMVRHSKDPDIWRTAVFSRWADELENIGVATYHYEGVTFDFPFAVLGFEFDSEVRLYLP